MPKLPSLALPSLNLDAEPICEWAEKNIVVSVSDRPGRLRLDPYQRGILEACAQQMEYTSVEQVSLMMSSQLGKTLLDAILLAWVIDQKPQATLIMHASHAGLDKFIREKLDPILLGTPSLNQKIGRNNRNAIPATGFSFGLGGFCTMTTARSKSSGHGTSASLVIADEIDDYDGATLVSSLSQRMITFTHPLLLVSSTPTLSGSSAIQFEYENGSQDIWYAGCPRCGHQQILMLDAVQMTDDDSECLGIECANCNSIWSETQRHQAVRDGVWVPTVRNPLHASFWMSQLYSMNVPLSTTMKKVAKYTKQETTTQILAWPFEEVILPRVDPKTIKRRIRDWVATYRTIGVDVQSDRLEYSVYEFDETLVRKHFRYHGIIPRGIDERSHWAELRAQVKYWAPQRLTVDGNYEFDKVRAGLMENFMDAWLHPDPPVEIIRGATQSSFDKPLRGARTATGWFWGSVDECKVLINRDMYAGHLTIDPEVHNRAEEQLTSERLVRTLVGKTLKREWRKDPHKRNEILDCTCYAYIGAVALQAASAYVSVRLQLLRDRGLYGYVPYSNSSGSVTR